MKVLVIINKGAGSAGTDEEEQILSEFQKYGIAATVKISKGNEIKDTVHNGIAEGYDVICGGGGDGTISAVAQGLAGTGTPLGVLPMGTLNHFAKDTGIPLNFEEAVKNIAEGRKTKIDTAEVNERIFINNSSLGAYPKAVKERKNHPKFLGTIKWFSTSLAAFKIFLRLPFINTSLKCESKEIKIRTPLIFVGNNEYNMEFLRFGKRDSLSEGRLCVYYLKCRTRFSLFKLFLQALFNRIKQSEDFEYFMTEEITIDTVESKTDVAVDGEITKTNSPLKYRIRKKDLNVILPGK